MTKHVRYLGPSNALDARPLFARSDETYIFERRGPAVEVTNDEAEELLSYPGHQFVEVDAADLEPDEAAARRNRLADAAAARQAKAAGDTTKKS